MQVLYGEEGLECEVSVNGLRFEHVSEFKFEAECHKKVASGRRVAGAIRSLVIVRDLQLESARVLLVPVLMSGNDMEGEGEV